ncbi:MAG: hypothetical protein QGH45_15870 [Myxococcota bacterium]|jgi:hypothetical protein|nr:hypothetical protein [Myxococcota bacterium]
MRTCVVVFGREPIAGQVKRRLASTLGEGATLAVYRALLDHALGAALASGLPVTFSLAAPLISPWRPPAGVDLALQPGGDLGQRMAGAFAERFEAGFDAAEAGAADEQPPNTNPMATTRSRPQLHLGVRIVLIFPLPRGGFPPFPTPGRAIR